MYGIAGAALFVAAFALTLLCYFFPAVVAVVEAGSAASLASITLSGRQWTLFARGALIAAAAAVLAAVLGAGFAAWLVSGRRASAITRWLGLAILMTPPYVYAYAWSLPLLPEGIATAPALKSRSVALAATYGRAILCLGGWLAPLAGFVLAAGWRSAGVAAYRLALTDASPLQALRRGAWPAMRRWCLLAISLAALLALTEYSVCHLCLVPVWNTELLSEAQNSARPGRLLLRSWPMLALAAMLVFAWFATPRFRRTTLTEMAALMSDIEHESGGRAVRSRWLLCIAAGCVMLAAAPLLVLAGWLRDPAALYRAAREFSGAWVGGLLCSVGAIVVAGLLALGVELGATAASRMRHAAPASLVRFVAIGTVALAVLFAAAPPAVVGDAFLAAYLSRFPLLADHWPIVSLTSAARYAVIAIVVTRLAGHTRADALNDLAALERMGLFD
ncbi:MAG: hypothetical protein D6744_13835, partial [Planctomycetota bacterium]